MDQLALAVDSALDRSVYLQLGDALAAAIAGGALRPGSAHEPEGERLLLERGASAEVARVCRSHARWRDLAQTLEELVIALADKLWKGARVAELEELVTARATLSTNRDRWELFTAFDSQFEEVASSAESQLSRSSSGEET